MIGRKAELNEHSVSFSIFKTLSRMVGALKGVFSQVKQIWKSREITFRTKIRILEATAMIKHSFLEMGAQRIVEDMLNDF